MTPAKTEIWNLAVGDLTESQLKNGIKKFCLAHEEIYPGTNVLAKIRKYALSLHELETASEAWEKVLLGASGAVVELDNEISERVVRHMGGFREMGKSENTELLRAHFIKFYNFELEKEKFDLMSGIKK
jgi:hypothetical protein